MIIFLNLEFEQNKTSDHEKIIYFPLLLISGTGIWPSPPETGDRQAMFCHRIKIVIECDVIISQKPELGKSGNQNRQKKSPDHLRSLVGYWVTEGVRFDWCSRV